MPATKVAGPAIKAVNTICEAVSSQARIIDDLLDVARVRTGKLKLKKQPIDLIRTLKDIHSVVLADGHRRQVSLQTPSVPGPLIVDVDPTRIEQVIWNLVNNALKFTPEDGQVFNAGNDFELDPVQFPRCNEEVRYLRVIFVHTFTTFEYGHNTSNRQVQTGEVTPFGQPIFEE